MSELSKSVIDHLDYFDTISNKNTIFDDKDDFVTACQAWSDLYGERLGQKNRTTCTRVVLIKTCTGYYFEEIPYTAKDRGWWSRTRTSG